MYKKNNSYIYTLAFLLLFSNCNKLVQTAPPKNTITTTEVFSDSVDANSGILGIYSNIFNQSGTLTFGNCAISLLCGASADEMGTTNTGYMQYYRNKLLSNDTYINTRLWAQPYTYIYQANAAIEGLQNSTTLSTSVQRKFLGEAKFFRAFCYFYLVNLFGDVPYVTSTQWSGTLNTAKSSQSLVYSNIISDLKDAYAVLPDDYSLSGGERTRVNKSAAAALLARAYLYNKMYDSAELMATNVINNPIYSLEQDLNNVFLATSNEAILQFRITSSSYPYNLTPEGYFNLPFNAARAPQFFLSAQLMSSFESGDQRKIAWVDSSKYSGKIYYYSYKYKLGPAQLNRNASPTEYYMVLRFAEQYLIRAEARLKENKLSDAIDDLNTIRNRAGLDSIYPSTSDEMMAAILHEKRIELFGEWGHRWLDLKRTASVDSIMTGVTPQKGGGSWASYKQLFPIPILELQNDPSLTQNFGY